MKTTLVLPFYNEEARIQTQELYSLTTHDFDVIFVDDGSTDGTRAALAGVAARASGQIDVLSIPRNAGKAEAVRTGLLAAVRSGAHLVGFADGDLSTPVRELARLSLLLRADPHLSAVLGSRVQLADRIVVRRTGRHYIGRVIATYLDVRTNLAVYDTQCGAKFFRSSPQLETALSTPFASRWLFDVELLTRLRTAHRMTKNPLRLREEPLELWHDVAGSRIRGLEVLRVLSDFARLERGLGWLPPHGTLSRASGGESRQPDLGG